MRSCLKENIAAPVSKTEINGSGGSPVLTLRHSPSTKFGIKIRRPVLVAQSVELACRLKATEFVFDQLSDCGMRAVVHTH
jgi:hypothetical protein